MKLNWFRFGIAVLTPTIIAGCFLFPDKKVKLRAALKDVCAQHPFNWYHLDKNMTYASDGKMKYQYKFGTKDRQFRDAMKKIFQKYIDTGADLTGKPKIEFLRKYLPNYANECLKSYNLAIEECSKYFGETDTSNYVTCVKKHDEDYKLTIEAFLIVESRDHDVVDFGKFSFEYGQKLKRQLQVDPAGTILGH